MKNDSTTILLTTCKQTAGHPSPPINNEYKQPLGCKPSARCNRHHTPPTVAQSHASKHQLIAMVPTGAQSSCPHTAPAPVQVSLAFITLCLLTTSATSGVVRMSLSRMGSLCHRSRHLRPEASAGHRRTQIVFGRRVAQVCFLIFEMNLAGGGF